MNGFWFGISLIIGIYLAISLMSEPLAQMIGIAVIPLSLLCLIIGIIIGNLVYLPSSWVRGTNYVKKNILQISESELDNYSTVSQEITVKMAESVKEKFNTDYSIAITGNAGPSVDSPETNLGDCFIAILSNNEIFSQKFHFNCNREDFIIEATKSSFQLFFDKIIKQ